MYKTTQKKQFFLSAMLRRKNVIHIAIVTIAFIIRAAVMIFFIEPRTFYKQADSFDYNHCAVAIAAGNGMRRLQNNEPIFWRTPGYPLYLVPFYSLYGVKSLAFEANQAAHHAALWFQLILSSCIPLILWYLTLTMTHLPALAYLVAWISAIHPGFVLASTYLLSEGIALIFFFLFLLFLYQLIIPASTHRPWYWTAIFAALMLSAYTWMRPMGEFVGYFSAMLLALGSIGHWKQKIKTAVLFFVLFFLSLTPWYYRNYRLTGEYFFCPTIGTYLNCFSVPKLLRRITGKPILECYQHAQQAAAQEVRKQQRSHPERHISPTACKAVSYPIIVSHPWYFLYDWITEVIKTMFDLYTYQLVAMFEGCYWYDPIEEYLPSKIVACLYASAIPFGARIICWLELIYALMLWIGLFGSLWLGIIRPLIKNNITPYTQRMRWLWLITAPMIGIIVGMTGGFGYARLRLPTEPLLIILSLTYWYWLYTKEKNHEKNVRTLAQ